MKCKIYTWLTPCHRWWHYQKRICRFLSSNNRLHVASLIMYSCEPYWKGRRNSLVSPLCVLRVMSSIRKAQHLGMNLWSMWQVQWRVHDYAKWEMYTPLGPYVYYTVVPLYAQPSSLVAMMGWAINFNECVSNARYQRLNVHSCCRPFW